MRDLRDWPLSGNHIPDVCWIKASAQRGCPQPGGLFLSRRKERNNTAPPMLDHKTGLLHEPQKRLKVGWLLFQRRNNGKPYSLLGRGRLFPDPLTVVEKTAFAMELGIDDHGQVIFQAYPVRQPPQRKTGADEIVVLPGAVIGCGIVVNVVMDMALVDVGTDKELILALRPAHSSFIANSVGLIRGYFSRFERLAYLIEQRPTVSLPARFGLVLAMHQQELRMCRGMVAKV